MALLLQDCLSTTSGERLTAEQFLASIDISAG